jgi:protein-tyrosine phosphatase
MYDEIEIFAGLWISGTSSEETISNSWSCGPGDVSNVPEMDFDLVVTLYPHTVPVGMGVEEIRYAFEDGPLKDNTIQKINEIADISFNKWKSGEKILIRCSGGLNRSGLLAAIILNKSGIDINKCIDLIKDKRGEKALGNKDFVNYLSDNFK